MSNNNNNNNNTIQSIKKTWRKGKWTEEEELYAEKIVEAFNAGVLDITTGTSLRSALSELLNCDPMRITKKFSGSCVGKLPYQPATIIEQQTKPLIELKTELEKAKKQFLNMVERSHDLQNSNFLFTTMTPYSQILQEYVPIMVESGENYHTLIHQHAIASLQQYPHCGYLNLPTNYKNQNQSNLSRNYLDDSTQSLNLKINENNSNKNINSNNSVTTPLISNAPITTLNQSKINILSDSMINNNINHINHINHTYQYNHQHQYQNSNNNNCNCSCNCGCGCSKCHCGENFSYHSNDSNNIQHYKKLIESQNSQSSSFHQNELSPYTSINTTPSTSTNSTRTSNPTNNSLPFIHQHLQYYQFLQSQLQHQEQNKLSQSTQYQDIQWGISSQYDINLQPRLTILFYNTSRSSPNTTNQPYIYLPPKYNLQYAHIFQNEEFQETIPMLSGYSIHPITLPPRYFSLDNSQKLYLSEKNKVQNRSYFNNTDNLNHNHHHLDQYGNNNNNNNNNSSDNLSSSTFSSIPSSCNISSSSSKPVSPNSNISHNSHSLLSLSSDNTNMNTNPSSIPAATTTTTSTSLSNSSFPINSSHSSHSLFSTSNSSNYFPSSYSTTSNSTFLPEDNSIKTLSDTILPHTRFFDPSYTQSLYPPIPQVSYPQEKIIHNKDNPLNCLQQDSNQQINHLEQHILNSNFNNNNNNNHNTFNNNNNNNNININQNNNQSESISPSSGSGVSSLSSISFPFYLPTQSTSTGLNQNNSSPHITSQSYDTSNNMNTNTNKNMYHHNSLIKKRKCQDSI